MGRAQSCRIQEIHPPSRLRSASQTFTVSCGSQAIISRGSSDSISSRHSLSFLSSPCVTRTDSPLFNQQSLEIHLLFSTLFHLVLSNFGYLLFKNYNKYRNLKNILIIEYLQLSKFLLDTRSLSFC